MPADVAPGDDAEPTIGQGDHGKAMQQALRIDERGEFLHATRAADLADIGVVEHQLMQRHVDVARRRGGNGTGLVRNRFLVGGILRRGSLRRLRLGRVAGVLGPFNPRRLRGGTIAGSGGRHLGPVGGGARSGIRRGPCSRSGSHVRFLSIASVRESVNEWMDGCMDEALPDS